MTGSERVRFLVFLSTESSRISEASRFIGKRLTEEFGGATILGEEQRAALKGYWAEDGNDFKSHYTGQIKEESVFGIMLTVLPEYEERALQEIKLTVREAVNRFDLGSRFVHLETSRTYANHFEISQPN